MRAHVVFVLVFVQLNVVFGWRQRLGREWRRLGLPDVNPDELPPAQWFTQKLDHFSAQDARVWRQRYFINDTFVNASDSNLLIFLMVEGEAPASPKWMTKGAWIEYAQELKAMCVMVEHRFYGDSQPLPDKSVKSLQYLSSKQALADLAYFIGSFNEKYSTKNVRWILFGGSYPGSLVAWMRLKYPHLVFASVSSSGPLRAVLDFQDYYRVVVEAITEKTGKQKCVELLKTAHKEVKVLMNTEPYTVETALKLCKVLKDASDLDIKTLHSDLADLIAGVVQYNEDNRLRGNLTDPKQVTINSICSMLSAPGSTFRNYADMARMLLKRDEEKCLDYSYDSNINDLRREDWGDAGSSERQWFYQTCTEFGFYQTPTSETDVFGNEFDVQYYIRQCMEVFGPQFNESYIREQIRSTNIYYGGTDIAASRVLYVHGSVDPWHALGLTATKHPDSPVIYIKGTAHCANMYPSSESDLPALKAARVTILKQLREWASMPRY